MSQRGRSEFDGCVVDVVCCKSGRSQHQTCESLLAVLKSEPRRQLGNAGLATDWMSFVLTWHKISRFLLLLVARAELGHNE
jgi:hypothetical protein